MNYLHAILVAVLFVFGCGGVPKGARETLTVSARALLVVDGVTATRYTEAAEQALHEATSLANYHDRMAPWDAAEEAIRDAKAALLVAEQALDAWDSTGDKKSFQEAAKVLARTLATVADVLTDVGIVLPSTLQTALNLAQAWGGTQQ